MTDDQEPKVDPTIWSWPTPPPSPETWGPAFRPPGSTAEGRVTAGWPNQPPMPWQPPPTARTNGLAVASMVLSLVWFLGLCSVLAVIFGHVAMGQIRRSEGQERGKGMALAGAIIGWIGCFIALIWWLTVIAAASDPTYYG